MIVPPGYQQLINESAERIELCRRLNEYSRVTCELHGSALGMIFLPSHFNGASIYLLRTYVEEMCAEFEKAVLGL